ncbi:MAG: hypothetical protein HC767_07410 [Akkermansiaceae bacterium]|nr:hypothetical protein [Akkermansiaceae bacterium]
MLFLGQSGSTRNLLNHYDRGRLVQQSYYGDSDGSLWDKRPWRYNPVQGGDYRGKSSRLIELCSDSTSLYSKSVPLHWATGAELPECLMEQWVKLEGSLVHARFQMTYSGTTTHSAHHQEIPAIFVDASLATLVTYTGLAPWTGAELTRRAPGTSNEYIKSRKIGSLTLTRKISEWVLMSRLPQMRLVIGFSAARARIARMSLPSPPSP